MIVLVSLALGLAGALFPPVNLEAWLVGLAALHDGPVLWLAVLATTVGHLVGKAAFYALGRGWLLRAVPAWTRRRHVDAHLVALPVGAPPVADLPAPTGMRARLRGWSGLHRVAACAERPAATAVLCLVSATLGLPPFAVVAVLLGRARMPFGRFLLLGLLGRLLRFAGVAGLSGIVLGRG